MGTVPDSDIRRFDHWAPHYDTSAMQRLFFVPIHARALELLARSTYTAPPACIVDIGCGTGRLLRAACSLWPDVKAFGVDPAERMVAEAARLNPAAVFKIAAAESLPLADQTADIVLSSMSFHHWRDQAQGIREIARVLRPGGLFCLADHTLTLTRLAGERAQSGAQVRRLLRRAGFTVLLQKWVRLPFILVTLARLDSAPVGKPR